jgi:drug/metabolite transporter (DMT)-like permease
MQLAPTTRGGTMLVAAMVCFAISDVVAKHLSAQIPPVVLAWCRYVLLLALVLPLAAMRPELLRTRRPYLQFLRSVGLVSSAVLFLLGLRLLPVAEATAMVFASPLFVTLLATLFLGERLSLLRWMPVAMGFAGVLVVVRPGAGVFGAAAMFPLLSSFAWACAVVCTRRLSAEDSSVTTTLYSALAGTAALSLSLPSLQVSLVAHVPALGLMACSWCAAQWLTVWAYRAAPAASIAPYSYSQLVWATLLSIVVFGHVPDAMSLLGMGVIVAAGVLAWRNAPRP